MYSHAQPASREEGCGGGKDASCTTWWVFYRHQHKQHGQFSFMEEAKPPKCVICFSVYIWLCDLSRQQCAGHSIAPVWFNCLSMGSRRKGLHLSLGNTCAKWRVSFLTLPISSYHSYWEGVFPWQPRGQKGQLSYNGPQPIVTVVSTHWQGHIARVVIIWCSENPSCSVSWDSLSLLTPHWPSGHCL